MGSCSARPNCMGKQPLSGFVPLSMVWMWVGWCALRYSISHCISGFFHIFGVYTKTDEYPLSATIAGMWVAIVVVHIYIGLGGGGSKANLLSVHPFLVTHTHTPPPVLHIPGINVVKYLQCVFEKRMKSPAGMDFPKMYPHSSGIEKWFCCWCRLFRL